jgi:hypothetical protein
MWPGGFRAVTKSEHGGKNFLEPAQRPDVTVAGGGLVQSQNGSRLAVAELLEVSQGQDFAIDDVHGVERLLDLDLDFGPDRSLARCRQPAEKLHCSRIGAGGGGL